MRKRVSTELCDFTDLKEILNKSGYRKSFRKDIFVTGYISNVFETVIT